jgi:hypothetical protein
MLKLLGCNEESKNKDIKGIGLTFHYSWKAWRYYWQARKEEKTRLRLKLLRSLSKLWELRLAI